MFLCCELVLGMLKERFWKDIMRIDLVKKLLAAALPVLFLMSFSILK